MSKIKGIVDALQVQNKALCSRCIIHHSDRLFHSWIQNSSSETTSNTLSCPHLVRMSLPSLLNTTFKLLPTNCIAKSVQRGKLWQMIFCVLPFFAWNLKIFQQRVIQHYSFSGLTFTQWQRGRIRVKWKTLTFLEVHFPQVCLLLISSICERRRSSQRSGQYLSSSLEGLVMFWSLPWETHLDWDVSLCLWWI